MDELVAVALLPVGLQLHFLLGSQRPAIVTKANNAAELLGETMHEILTDTKKATRHVRDYYRADFRQCRPRTGASFDQWAGGGDRPDIANQLTGDDCVAVSLLSVEVPPMAAIGLMRDEKENVDRLLSLIPTDVRMCDLDAEGYEKHLGMESPAQELWEVITRRNGKKWDIGRTTASKIMARKRPHLIPIVDSVIEDLIGTVRHWRGWHEALTNDTGLPDRLAAIKADSGAVELGYDPSMLRVMDIVLWMEGLEVRRGRRNVSEAVATVLLP
ncbi:DUF6308 family protein [Arthrobacter sp. MDT2-16]